MPPRIMIEGSSQTMKRKSRPSLSDESSTESQLLEGVTESYVAVKREIKYVGGRLFGN